jgi:hypothetical protein
MTWSGAKVARTKLIGRGAKLAGNTGSGWAGATKNGSAVEREEGRRWRLGAVEDGGQWAVSAVDAPMARSL